MVLQQHADDAHVLLLDARCGIVQRRPAFLVHVGVARHQGLDGVDVALERGHHQRAFVLLVACLHLQAPVGDEGGKHLERLGLDRQRQPHLPLRVADVGVEPAAQQVVDGVGVVPLHGRKEVLVGTRPGGSGTGGQCQGAQQRRAAAQRVARHAFTPLNKVSKLRLVASATSSTAMPRVCATCLATWGT